jgi:hypothetical protein
MVASRQGFLAFMRDIGCTIPATAFSKFVVEKGFGRIKMNKLGNRQFNSIRLP